MHQIDLNEYNREGRVSFRGPIYRLSDFQTAMQSCRVATIYDFLSFFFGHVRLCLIVDAAG